jgi:hypothetical protein
MMHKMVMSIAGMPHMVSITYRTNNVVSQCTSSHSDEHGAIASDSVSRVDRCNCI